MLISMFYLRDGVTRLGTLAGTCKTLTDITQIKTKVSVVLADMIFACEEVAFTTDSYQYSKLKSMLMDTNRSIQNSDNKDHIKTLIETAVTAFEGTNYDNLSTYNFKRECSNRAMRFVPTNTTALEQVAKAIPRMSRNIQFLDVRCNEGQNLTALTKGFDHKITYGIEADQNVASRARNNVNRVAMGQFAGSRITNEAFDVMMVEPLMSWSAEFNGNQSPLTFKNEKVFLLNTIRYLRPNGIGIMILPYYKLYKDVSLFIAKNFDNVQVRRLSSDFFSTGHVVITGTKVEEPRDLDENIYQMLRKCHNQDKIDDILVKPLDAYTLPRELEPIDIFRGSVLDPNELLSIVKASGCMENFWKNQKVEKLSESSKQPLLPFSIGQIGLVLTSGCLDGIIDEGNGHYHLIKGKVSKQSNIERNYNDNESEIETQETISNRVEINVVLPNGEYKVLA